jgi:hypothetical protein
LSILQENENDEKLFIVESKWKNIENRNQGVDDGKLILLESFSGFF